MPFSHLPAALAGALEARGYAAPTPVQAAVLEPEALGRDLVVSAQTGSGKTVAFGLAMATDLIVDGVLPPPGAPLALIIAPTRELALQVSRELIWLYGPRARASPPAWAAWTPARSAARWGTARTSSSARRGGCATISSAAR